MLADTSLPHGSDVSLSTVGSLSQELSHRRITLTACPGRIPLVEQRVLSQLTLLKQPVKRLSCRAHIARLEPIVMLLTPPMTLGEPMFVRATHLPVACDIGANKQRRNPFDVQDFWRTCPDTSSI